MLLESGNRKALESKLEALEIEKGRLQEEPDHLAGQTEKLKAEKDRLAVIENESSGLQKEVAILQAKLHTKSEKEKIREKASAKTINELRAHVEPLKKEVREVGQLKEAFQNERNKTKRLESTVEIVESVSSKELQSQLEEITSTLLTTMPNC
jgi:uncharacterized protein involved in exopolysaccharide biosynthesis